MIGVTFGTKHSYDDFGLILSSKEIGLPEPKTESVSVIGRNGDIDLTDALGDTVTFENRKITLTFSVLNAHIYWTSVLSTVSNYLHGKKMQVILDADKTFYYYGRCKVNKYKSNKTLGELVIECDVEPYKIEVNGAGVPWLWDTFSFVNGIIHVNEVTVNGSVTENLINRAKVVSPTFTCSAAMKVTYNGTTYSLAAGTTTVYDIRLQEGDNYVTFSGKGTVKINYKGGSL
jgi:hypothetical protein